MNQETRYWLMASQTCFVVSPMERLKRGCAGADVTLALPLLSSGSVSMTTSVDFGINVNDLQSDIVNIIVVEKIFSENSVLSNQTRNCNNSLIAANIHVTMVAMTLREPKNYGIPAQPGRFGCSGRAKNTLTVCNIYTDLLFSKCQYNITIMFTNDVYKYTISI